MCKTTQQMYNRGCGQHTCPGTAPLQVPAWLQQAVCFQNRVEGQAEGGHSHSERGDGKEGRAQSLKAHWGMVPPRGFAVQSPLHPPGLGSQARGSSGLGLPCLHTLPSATGFGHLHPATLSGSNHVQPPAPSLGGVRIPSQSAGTVIQGHPVPHQATPGAAEEAKMGGLQGSWARRRAFCPVSPFLLGLCWEGCPLSHEVPWGPSSPVTEASPSLC